MPTAAQNINAAINAYNQTVSGGKVSDAESSSKVTGGEDFATMVKGAMQDAVNLGKAAESASISGIKNEADMHQVVTAVAEAELTLRTAVGIRDKVIEAYREIIRMPI